MDQLGRKALDESLAAGDPTKRRAHCVDLKIGDNVEVIHYYDEGNLDLREFIDHSRKQQIQGQSLR